MGADNNQVGYPELRHNHQITREMMAPNNQRNDGNYTNEVTWRNNLEFTTATHSGDRNCD